LAALVNPVNASDKLDGRSFTEFYGNLTANVGSKLNDARSEKTSQTQLSNQVKSLRDQVAGVSLDEEAIHLMEFQRAYQATARMVTALDELLDIALNIGRR
jgi:flagellar hook-associated protein 1